MREIYFKLDDFLLYIYGKVKFFILMYVKFCIFIYFYGKNVYGFYDIFKKFIILKDCEFFLIYF